MTTEQRIRGADAGVDWALLLTGYSQDALMELVATEFGAQRLEQRGAAEIIGVMYRMDYSLSRSEIDA